MFRQKKTLESTINNKYSLSCSLLDLEFRCAQRFKNRDNNFKKQRYLHVHISEFQT